MATKKVKISMTASPNGRLRLRKIMKKMGFSDEDRFLRYCVLKTVKRETAFKDKSGIDKELKMIALLEKETKKKKK